MDKFFEPGDFEELEWSRIHALAQHAAGMANRKLAKYLESCPTVFAAYDAKFDCWSDYSTLKEPFHTHQAKTICIEELPKECVKHEPVWELKILSALFPGKLAPSYFGNPKCAKCGIELVAEWKAK